MSWLELDDGILRHPKFIRAVRLAGSEAIHLWLGLRAYCGQLLTDGEIPRDMVDVVDGPTKDKARTAALTALIQVGLVEETDAGLLMHDYLDWSKSRAEIEARRQSSVDRQRRYRGNLPPVTRDNGVTDALVTRESQSPARAAPLLSDPLLTDPDRKDAPRRSEPSSGTPIAEFSFRCDGKTPTWNLTQEYLVELETAFPHLNVLAEVRKALAWTRVNPEKQKTARGMPAFLFRWLSKAQDSGSTAQSKPARQSRPLGPSVVAELEKWKRIDGEGGTT